MLRSFVSCKLHLFHSPRQHGSWLHSRWCCEGVSVWSMWTTCRPYHRAAYWTGTVIHQVFPSGAVLLTVWSLSHSVSIYICQNIDWYTMRHYYHLLNYNSIQALKQFQSCNILNYLHMERGAVINVEHQLFQSLPQRDFVIMATRTPQRGDSASAAGNSLDKEWVTEHARQVGKDRWLPCLHTPCGLEYSRV